jgi:predicted RNA-binding Zn ribbon-like protein
MPQADKPPFLFLGNHAALDYVNTEVVSGGGVADLLGDFRDLVRWLREAGGLSPAQAREVERAWGGSSEAEAALRRAKELRATLRGVAEGLSRGGRASPAALGRINEALRLRRGRDEVVPAGGGYERRFSLDLGDPLHLLGPLGEFAADLLCHADPARVRKCENPKCILYFYDTSKGHGRRWCRMGMCGNRLKVAAHYARQQGGR